MVVANNTALRAKQPLTLRTFFVFYLPYLLALQLTAILVVAHKSRRWRLVVLPFTLWTAFRLATTVDLASRDDPVKSRLNQDQLFVIFVLFTRAVGWTLDKKRYQREAKYAQTDALKQDPMGRMVKEALVLILDFRGVGWNWGKRGYIPLMSTSRLEFLRARISSIMGNLVIFNLTVAVLNFISPMRDGRGTYDMSLPFVQRHFLASTSSILLTITLGLVIDMGHSVCALVAVSLFRDDPASWPKLFHAPLFATSLADFWGRRWHQLLRHGCVMTGGRPLSRLFGRAGHVLGTFFVSGVAHALGTWDVGKTDECFIVVRAFVAMGVGIILERTWKDLTGRNVGGPLGRLWMFVWMCYWFNDLFDIWTRA